MKYMNQNKINKLNKKNYKYLLKKAKNCNKKIKKTILNKIRRKIIKANCYQ